jgi:hypothetical protein
MIYLYYICPRQVRVFRTVMEDKHDICASWATGTIVSKATLPAGDQIWIASGDSKSGAEHWFQVEGVSFRFYGDAVVVGTDGNGQMATQGPSIDIDDFRSLVTFSLSWDKFYNYDATILYIH